VVRKKLNKAEQYELVLNSPNYARLFFLIMKDPDYTESLAKKINKEMGTVGERLYHLMSVGLIKKMKKKEGRKQYYEVNIDGIHKVFVNELAEFMRRRAFFYLSKEEAYKNAKFLQRVKKFKAIYNEPIKPDAYEMPLWMLTDAMLKTHAWFSLPTSKETLREFITEDIYANIYTMKYSWDVGNRSENARKVVKDFLPLFEPQPITEEARDFLSPKTREEIEARIKK